MGNVKRLSSASEAAKLTSLESLDSKDNSAFSVSVLHLVLLMYTVLSTKLVVPRESGRFGGVAGSVVLYVKCTMSVRVTRGFA